VARALIDGVSGTGAAAATKVLRDAIAEAATSGFVDDHLAARLALGQVELKRGRTASARADLRKLARDARARGEEMYARLAEAALR
jgi:hypothetical protein